MGQCQSVDAAAEVDALVLLAGRTIPFLGPDRLRGVWSEPTWIGCVAQPDVVRSALMVLDAMARRDFGAVGSSAIALLNGSGQVLSPSARDWLLRAAMLAAIAQHDYGAVGSIEASIGKGITPVEGSETQRAYLLAFADARLKPQSGP